MDKTGLRDADIEAGMRTALAQMVAAKDEPTKRAAWNQLCNLHAQRSPEQVRRIEQQRGLR